MNANLYFPLISIHSLDHRGETYFCFMYIVSSYFKFIDTLGCSSFVCRRVDLTCNNRILLSCMLSISLSFLPFLDPSGRENSNGSMCRLWDVYRRNNWIFCLWCTLTCYSLDLELPECDRMATSILCVFYHWSLMGTNLALFGL